MSRSSRLLPYLFVAVGYLGAYEFLRAFVDDRLALPLEILFLPAGVGLLLGRDWARTLGIGLAAVSALVTVATAALVVAGISLPELPVFFGGAELTRWTPGPALFVAGVTVGVLALSVWALRVLRRHPAQQFIATT